MVVVQPGRVQPVMLGCRSEVPDVRVAVAGQERIARQLVARPFADDGAGRVADVVLVETEQRAQTRLAQRRARARQTVIVQPSEIDALLEIDLRVTGRLDGPRPVVVRIDVIRADELRLRDPFLCHGSVPWGRWPAWCLHSRADLCNRLRNTKTINDPGPTSKRRACCSTKSRFQPCQSGRSNRRRNGRCATSPRRRDSADSAGARKVELPEIPKAGSFRPGSEEK